MNWKRLTSMLLALCLVLTLAPPAYAAAEENTSADTAITVRNGETVTLSAESGVSYYYKIETTGYGQFICLNGMERFWACSADGSISGFSSWYSGRCAAMAGAPGEYCFYLKLEGGYPEGEYSFTVSLADNDANEPNNTADTATPLTPGEPVEFTLSRNDVDYFTIETTKPGQDVALTFSGFNYAAYGYFYAYIDGESVGSIGSNGTRYFHFTEAGSHTICFDGWYYSSGEAAPTSPAVTLCMTAELLDGDANEPNDTQATATMLPIGKDMSFAMGGYGDEDWFWFESAFDEGKEQKLYTLNFLDLNSDYSDVFYYDIYAPDGTAVSTKTMVNIRHANVFACTQEGVYALRVYNGGSTTARSTLRVRIDEGGADPYENNDTWLTAAPVQTGQPISFQLSTTADRDWFRFVVPEANMTAVVTLTAGAQTKYYLYSGETLEEKGSSDGWGYNSYYLKGGSLSTGNYAVFRYKFTDPGVYYLCFCSDSSYVSQELRTVTIDLLEATAEENNDTWKTATPIYENVPQHFDLSAYNDVDWFKIEVPESGGVLYIEQTRDSEYDDWWDMYLYRAADFETAGDDAGAVADVISTRSDSVSITLRDLAAGTYYVKARSSHNTSYYHQEDCTIRYTLYPENPAGSSIDTAAALTVGEWTEGWYDGERDHYYSLGALAAGTELRCYGENVYWFSLYNEAGSKIANVNMEADAAFSIPSDGAYYLCVTMSNSVDQDGEALPYRVLCDVATEEMSEADALWIETAEDEVTLLVGEEWYPAPRVFPYTLKSGKANGCVFSTSSSNSEVASISGYNMIVGQAAGTATIKFNLLYSSVYKAITVNVVEPTAAESLTISGAPETLPLGTAVTLAATLNEGANGAVRWESSDSAVLYVNGKGRVTAVGDGTATITATTDSGVSDSVEITVTDAPEKKTVTGITLDDYDLTLYLNEEPVRLTATVTPADADNATVTWSTTNSAVAGVTQQGEVTAAAPGVCVITAAAGSYRASCVVTVLAARTRVESIAFDCASLDVLLGSTSALHVTFTPDDATVKTVTFVSSDPGVASVSRTGVVTALAVGTTTVTATTLDGGHSASIEINVISEGVKGDINGDGYVDSADAMMVLQYAVGKLELSETQQKAADVNGDGYIDAADAIRILRYNVGLIDSL